MLLVPRDTFCHTNDIQTSDYVMTFKNADLCPLDGTPNTPYYCLYTRLGVTIRDMELIQRKKQKPRT